jgi:hypothetical protein
VRHRIGPRPYLLLTQAAAKRLALTDAGLAYREEYPDVGGIDVRLIDLADLAGIA